MTTRQGSYRDAMIAVIILLVLQALLSVKVGVYKGHLGDTDVYMWVNRVTDLQADGNWSDHSLARINPPEGYEQHWTRPYDALLYAGAWLGSQFTDFRTALHVWAVLISPVLEILALFAFLWAIWPLSQGRENGIAGLLFVTQMGIIASFVAGRADHQGLILLLFILTLGLGLRLLDHARGMRLCFLAALASALAIWISVEAILLPLVLMASLGLFWLAGQEPLLRTLARYSVGLWFLLVLFRLIEFGPARFTEPALDQISIVYITLFGLAAIFWVGQAMATARLDKTPGTLVRALSMAVWACVALVVMATLFPGFLSGPMSQVDPLFQEVHLAKIKELQPAISLTALAGDNGSTAFAKSFLWVGILVPGIPILIYFLWHTRDITRRRWALLALVSLAYVPLAVMELRWSPYVAILMLPGYIGAVVALMQLAQERLASGPAAFARIGVLVGSVVIFALPTVLLSDEEEGGDARKANCPLMPVSAFLASPALDAADRPANLLAFTDFGPELLYRTPHNVMSIPSHRPHSGFNDSYNIMTAADPDTAHALARDRNVDYILICPDGHENHFYKRDDDRPTLFSHLSEGTIPDWLEPVSLPESSAGQFRLYRVTSSPDPGKSQ